MALPRVAIIGRANVGKSTLFNRLTSGSSGGRAVNRYGSSLSHAIVSPIAGTTRNRKEGVVTWLGRSFTLIDTGGLDVEPENVIDTKIAEHAYAAAQNANLILFVVDVRDGILPADRSIAQLLRKLTIPIILIANKADRVKDIQSAPELFRLGFGTPLPVSAISGVGSGDLLDIIFKQIKPGAYKAGRAIRIAIVGKPNVGKSSLVNALAGSERSIVHDEPHTTRDTNEVPITFKGTPLMLLDTAGVRRKSRVSKIDLEHDSVQLSLEAIRSADVTLLVTETHIPLTGQDLKLAELIDQSRASAIIIANKWDLARPDERGTAPFEAYYRKMMNFLSWAPIMFLSASERTKLTKLLDLVLEVYEEQSRTVTDNALQRFLKQIVKRQPPTRGRGTKKPYIKLIRQVGTKPPQFVVEIEQKTSIRFTYLNYIERMLREKFGFMGSPIKIWVEKPKE